MSRAAGRAASLPPPSGERGPTELRQEGATAPGSRVADPPRGCACPGEEVGGRPAIPGLELSPRGQSVTEQLVRPSAAAGAGDAAGYGPAFRKLPSDGEQRSQLTGKETGVARSCFTQDELGKAFLRTQ